MRQPRTFSERLELLNRLNRRQAVAPGAEEDDESEAEGVLGAEEDDSGSEADDNLDDSDDNGSVSDSDSEGDFSGEEEDSEDEDEEEEEEAEGAVLPTAPPAAGAPTPGIGQPEASAAPAAPESPGNAGASESPQASADPATPESSAAPQPLAGSMSVINPAPTGVANNPVVPSSAADSELSTTEQIVSQITSAAGEAAPSPSNSLAQEEKESTETVSDAEASATGEELNDGGEASSPALARGQEAGIIIGAIAGLGAMMSVGFVLFKWRKRRNASVYDRPPPPGIYSEDEKRKAEVGVAQIPEEQAADQGQGGGMFRVVNSWIQNTPNRYSRGGEAAPPAPPAPAFLTPGRNRDTMNTRVTGSEAKWG